MEQVKKFIRSLNVSPKLIDELSADDLLQKHRFYLDLAHYLAPIFPAVDEGTIYRLTGYSYLYFRFLLGLDSLIDGQTTATDNSLTTQRIFSYISIHEQAIRGLTQLFPAHDDFWAAFELCKQEYASSNLREKQLSTHRTPFSLNLFEEIAAGKSAVCYAMVYALSSLSSDASSVQELQRCLKHLHIAMQCLDDVDDFKQDWQEGQFTYAHSLVSVYLGSKVVSISQLPVAELHQYLYTSGVAEQLVQKSNEHYRTSLAIAESLCLADLESYLKQQIRKCENYQQDIERLLQKTRIKASKSFTPLHAEIPELSSQHLHTAISRALQHLRLSRDAQGCWSDFMTSAGQSKLWATAYAGLQLAETKVGFRLAHDAFDASFLLPPSYNESILQDGDSTNFRMGLSRRVWGEANPQQLEAWLSFMDPDGGWVTYRHADKLRERLELAPQVSVHDWLTSKACVTAAAAYVLRFYNELASQYQASCRYLARHQHPEGYWISYWWTSPIYATAFAVMALTPLAEHVECREAAMRWLAAQQAADGAWYDSTTAAQPSAFFTALAVKALLTEPSKLYASVIERSIRWLLGQQMNDGSWLTSRILRIPATNVHDPRTVGHWRKSSFGVNVLVDDHNRIFTTSTVLNALDAFVRTKSFVQDTLVVAAQ